MTTFEIVSLIIGFSGLILGGVANFRINKFVDSNEIKSQNQVSLGDKNKQAGRDIIN